MSISLFDTLVPAGNFPAVEAENVSVSEKNGGGTRNLQECIESLNDDTCRLKIDVNDCVRNIVAETDRFEESVPAENQGLIEDAGNVLAVHGNTDALGVPLLSDCKNQIPSPYSLTVTSSKGVTFSPYYRYLTINSSGTDTGLVTSYLPGNTYVSISETDLQAGGGFHLIVQKNRPYPDAGSPIMRIQIYDSAKKQLKCYDVTLGDSDTFFSGVYAIPDTAVSFRVAIRIPSNAVYDNVTIYPIIIKSDAVLKELGTEPLADGAKLELPYSEIAAISSVNTFNYEHSYRYKIDTKTYIDNHVSEVKMTYTTPEDFGAVGDGIADDSAAVEQCMAYGSEFGVPVRMNQKYLISSGLKIGSNMDVFINYLIYSGTDTAVIFDCEYSKAEIRSVQSNGMGIRFCGETKTVRYNSLCLGKVVSKSHCISLEGPSYPVFNNRIVFDVLNAGGDGCFCITNRRIEYTQYVTENTFIGGQCTNADWAYYGSGANNKFYNINVENNMKGGYCFVYKADALIIGGRHEEAQRDGEYPFIKIKSNTAIDNGSAGLLTGLRFISPIGLRVNEIDVSEAATTQITSDGLTEKALLSNGSLGHLDCRITSYTGYKSNEPKLYQCFGESCIIWGNTLIFQDTPYKYYIATESLDLRTITEDTPCMPSVFEIACENCEIHLHPTYCFMGIRKFDVIQTETYQAKIYDYFTDSLVFDGTQYGAGTFEIANYLNGQCARINGENMVWAVGRKDCGNADFQEASDEDINNLFG